MACQPAAANIASTRRIRIPGTTRSRLCRLRSTIIVMFPRSPRPSSRIASQTLPSSSSASPTRATNRRSGRLGDRVVEVEPDVAVGQGREHRGDGAQADRARREVDRIRVLGPRRVRLQPAELAEPQQHRLVEVAEQVLDGVVGRRGVRLDRDEVAGPEPAEVERGQDRDDRGARGLVATDLDPVAVRPDVVGLVDHPDREPQDPSRDGVERLVVGAPRRRGDEARCGGRGFGDGHRCDPPPSAASATRCRPASGNIGTTVPNFCYRTVP